MSKICECDQIHKKISSGMVKNLERMEQSQNVKSQNWIVHWIISRFQNFWFEWVKQTFNNESHWHIFHVLSGKWTGNVDFTSFNFKITFKGK